MPVLLWTAQRIARPAQHIPHGAKQLDDDSDAQQQAIIAALAKAEADARAQMRQHVIENQQQLLQRAAQTSDLRASADELAAATSALFEEVQGTHKRMHAAHAHLAEATAELQRQRDAVVALRAMVACQQKWELAQRAMRPGAAAAPAPASGDGKDGESEPLDIAAAVRGISLHGLSELSAALHGTLAALANPACRQLPALAALKLQVDTAVNAALEQCHTRLAEAVHAMNTVEISLLLHCAHAMGGLLPAVDAQLAQLARDCSDEASRAFDIRRISGSGAAPAAGDTAFPPPAEREAWGAALWDSGAERLATKLGTCATKAWMLQHCLHNCVPKHPPAGSAPPSLFAVVLQELLRGAHTPAAGSVLPAPAALPVRAEEIGAWLPGASVLGVQGLWGLWWSAVCAAVAAAAGAVPRSGFVFDQLTEQYPRLRVLLSDCLSTVQRSCASRLLAPPAQPAARAGQLSLHAALQKAAATKDETQFGRRMDELCVLLARTTHHAHSSALGASSLAHARALYCTMDRFASAFVRAREDEMLALAATSVHGAVRAAQSVHDPHSGLPVVQAAAAEHLTGAQECDGHVPSFADVTAIVKACSGALLSSPGDGALLYELSTSIQRAVVVFSTGALALAGGAASMRSMGSHWQPSPQQRAVCGLLTRLQQLATGLRQSIDAAVKRASALSAGSQGAAQGAFTPMGPQAETLFSQQLQGAAAAAPAAPTASASECIPGAKVLLAHVWQPASAALATASSCLVSSYCTGLRSGLLAAASEVAREGYDARVQAAGAVQDEARWVRQLQQAAASAFKFHLAAFPAEGGLRERVGALLGAQVRLGVMLLAACQQGMEAAARMQLAQDVAHAEACLGDHFSVVSAASAAQFQRLRQLLQLPDPDLCAAASDMYSPREDAPGAAQSSSSALPVDCTLLLLLSRVKAPLPFEQSGQPAHEWVAEHVARDRASQRAEHMLQAVQRCIEHAEAGAATGADKDAPVTCLSWLRDSAPHAVQCASDVET